MKRYLFIALLFSVLISRAQLPVWQWAQSGNGAASDNCLAVATDTNNNVYTTGYFYSPTLTFSSTTLTNNGNYDIFICKYDATGNLMWSRGAGGAFDDVGNAITCDPSGNVIVTGYFTSSTLIFGTYTLTNSGGEDVFTVKYDPSGNVVWAQSFGDNSIEEGNQVSCDGAGNVFVSGQFQSSTLTFGTYTLNCSGIGDMFVIKYSGSGAPLWATSAGGSLSDISYGISSDAGGNIITTGYFRSDTIYFGAYKLANASTGTGDIFLVKYDNMGNVLWATNAGSNSEDVGYAATLDASGNIYLTGAFKSNTITLGATTHTNSGAGSYDSFIAKFNSLGNVIWSKSFGGTLDDISYAIDCDPLGNAILTGHIHSSGFNAGGYNINNAGTGDAFLIKYNSTGVVLFGTNVGAVQDEGSSGVATDLNGDVLLAGFFYSSNVAFGGNTVSNTGNSDAMLAKLTFVTNVAENSDNTFISFYPNPAKDKFKIRSSTPIHAVSFLDMTGKKVFSVNEIQNGVIEISEFARGIYILEINCGEEIIRKKIVLE